MSPGVRVRLRYRQFGRRLPMTRTRLELLSLGLLVNENVKNKVRDVPFSNASMSLFFLKIPTARSPLETEIIFTSQRLVAGASGFGVSSSKVEAQLSTQHYIGDKLKPRCG